jgi:hypothetical protein
LQWAKAGFQSPQGFIYSYWRREAERVLWEVRIPEGSSAVVNLPWLEATQIKRNGESVDENRFELTAGRWIIETN